LGGGAAGQIFIENSFIRGKATTKQNISVGTIIPPIRSIDDEEKIQNNTKEMIDIGPQK